MIAQVSILFKIGLDLGPCFSILYHVRSTTSCGIMICIRRLVCEDRSVFRVRISAYSDTLAYPILFQSMQILIFLP